MLVPDFIYLVAKIRIIYELINVVYNKIIGCPVCRSKNALD